MKEQDPKNPNYPPRTSKSEKPYIAQRLNVFLAGLKHLPHDTEVCVESGRPAGWTYSEREGRVYIHQ